MKNEAVNAVTLDLSKDSYEPQILSDMTKLSNSVVLNSLGEKLNHFEPSGREDLKNIFMDYKHLFSDVPSRTDLEMIYHNVEIARTLQIQFNNIRTI